jgi:ergothioneine biosynthesis protein EgtB
MPDTSPVKWHLAHTSWFFETFFLEHVESHFTPFHPVFRVLFNSYYNMIGERHARPERGLITRPGLGEILAYRQDIDTRIASALRTPVSAELLAVLELGLHHEQQHQELILTDLKHLLSRNPLQPSYREGWPLTQITPRKSGWIDYAGGPVEIGHHGDAFAFDNELPRHTAWLIPFQLARNPVTYGEFAEFLEDGGYTRPELWLSLGWDWVNRDNISHPLYWQRVDGRWHTYTLRGLAPISHEVPIAHVNYFEADAYARWAGGRLPTEAEWEHAAQGVSTVGGHFANSGIYHPLAPDTPAPEGQPAQLFGDVWEWTQTSYAPYPGFRPAPGAVGEYNGKFMCNQYVLRGGSCATPQDHIRASYRNFFPPEARWQFSGLRLARDHG